MASSDMLSSDDDSGIELTKMVKELKWDQERLSSRIIRLEHDFIQKEKVFLHLEKTNCLKYQELRALLDHMKETAYQARIKELEEATQKLNAQYAKNLEVIRKSSTKDCFGLRSFMLI